MAGTIKFGTDGWRAVIAEDYTFDNVRICAQGTAQYLKELDHGEGPVVIGYDTRFQSRGFAAAVAEVLTGNGIRVHMCDRPAPTPIVSYSIIRHEAKAGIIITASHNPGIYNGYKFRAEYGGAASPDMTDAVESHIHEIREKRLPVARKPLDEARKENLIEDFNPVPDYVEQIRKLVDLDRIRDSGLHVVCDAMHGAGGGYFPHLMEGAKTRIAEIRGHPNPAFPDMHGPEPIGENLKPLMTAVLGQEAQLGIANDGDADRIGIVDEKGNFVNQLEVYGLLLLYLLEVRGLRGPAVKTVTSSSMVNKLGDLYGVPIYETAVGFKYVGPKMLEVDALIGGEESGGFAFRGHVPERDGILAGLFIMDMMIDTGKAPSELVKYLFEKTGPSYYDRIDLRFPADQRSAIIRHIESSQAKRLAGMSIIDISRSDGFKYFLEDGSWVLIRFSGTEPILRVYTETNAEEKVAPLLSAGRELAGV